MQPRRSSRLNRGSSGAGSSSQPPSSQPQSSQSARKRARQRPSRDVSPELVEPENESLSETDSDNGIVNPMGAAETVVNQAKEARYHENRLMYRTKLDLYPELMQPHKTPLTPRFISMAATERFQGLKDRKFIDQHRISLTDENLADVRSIVENAGLLHTLTDVDAYQPSVVREFIANLLEASERDVGVAVYLRASMIDFSPSLINAIYCIPGFEDDPNWLDENIDEVCGFLTDGQINRWENMSSKFLSPTNQVLYKLVCTNWIPTMNYTNMNQTRLKFVYMLHHNEDGFNFGKLVYDQIMQMAENTKKKKSRRIMFPTLIQQVINFQRIVPIDYPSDEFTGFPKLVVKDIKAGRGTGADTRSASLEEDIERTIASLKGIYIRLRRGEYVVHQPPPTMNQDDEVAGDTEELSQAGDTEELSRSISF
ncbi:uncharacterized protein LOC130499861 [Raphanus sativus]|uniref:Uncharacterized protein LOC130499861 n=1 Tax=Raphanus sativus TaxID=3726 RepID=A0A9W3CFV0_RAPSA|nr:uncharacterized protein LOC130499861 [Raphanus sativus]